MCRGSCPSFSMFNCLVTFQTVSSSLFCHNMHKCHNFSSFWQEVSKSVDEHTQAVLFFLHPHYHRVQKNYLLSFHPSSLHSSLQEGTKAHVCFVEQCLLDVLPFPLSTKVKEKVGSACAVIDTACKYNGIGEGKYYCCTVHYGMTICSCCL